MIICEAGCFCEWNSCCNVILEEFCYRLFAVWFVSNFPELTYNILEEFRRHINFPFGILEADTEMEDANYRKERVPLRPTFLHAQCL